MNTSIKPPQLNKSLVLSSQHRGWNGILVEQYQSPPTSCEGNLPALEAHWLNFLLGKPIHLTQKRDDRLHESIVQKGDMIFVPAGQPSYWRSLSDTQQSILHIHLRPELVTQIAETSELDRDRISLTHCFSQYDLHIMQIAMMLLAELKSGGIMGELYVESLTQVLVIHLLRHYSTSTQTIPSVSRSLTHVRLQQAIDYIHAHLDSCLSLVQIARSINISPTYFASLFKQATGISLHQYVIKQRVERAKLLLTTTDLPIASIASQVGFSSQSHLNQHCKRLTGMTPKQLSKTIGI
jgi:AraC family transcriptional regulator